MTLSENELELGMWITICVSLVLIFVAMATCAAHTCPKCGSVHGTEVRLVG